MDLCSYSVPAHLCMLGTKKNIKSKVDDIKRRRDTAGFAVMPKADDNFQGDETFKHKRLSFHCLAGVVQFQKCFHCHIKPMDCFGWQQGLPI